jgi:peroxiredoxin
MKQFLSLYLLLLASNTFAQDKLELEGVVKGYEGKIKLILNTITADHEADMVNEEVIYMIDGQFKIERKLKEPTLLSIRIRPEITEDFDPRSFESAFIWVDNKKMTLNAEKGNFEYCDVTGYSRQDDNEKSKNYVRDRLMAYRQSIDSLSRLQTPEAKKEADQLKTVSEVYLRNKYRLDHCYLNPNSYIAVYGYSWFVKWIPEMVPKSHAIEFYNLLNDSLKATTPGKQIKYYIDNIAVNKRLIVGDSPYDFTLPDSTSTAISLSSFKDQVILLDFWASSCGPCRKEHANYFDLYEQFKDKGFEIISVSQDRKKERWLKAMNKDRMIWVSLWDEDMSISKYTYLVSAIPDNYLINRNGIIIAKNVRGDELRKILTEAIEE